MTENQNAKTEMQHAIGVKLHMIKQSVADYLDRHLNTCSTRAKKTGIITFGLTTGTLCVFLITGVFENDSEMIFPVDKITIPQKIKREQVDSIITVPDEYNLTTK